MWGAIRNGARLWGKTLFTVILASFFLALFFLMPTDFCWSSWHLLAARGTTTGTVVSAVESVGSGRGHGTRSDIVYRYRVNGIAYEGSRVRSGFMDKGYEGGGGEFARSLKPGDAITVHYSERNPAFAFLSYGWPKWSLGFSLVVWGIVASAIWCEKSRDGEIPVPFWGNALIRALPWTGILTTVFLAPVIVVTDIWIPLAIHAGAVLLLAAYWRIKYQRRPGSGEPTRWLRPQS